MTEKLIVILLNCADFYARKSRESNKLTELVKQKQHVKLLHYVEIGWAKHLIPRQNG
jgi:hypothetical protein